MCTVCGWGDTELGGPASQTLLEIEVMTRYNEDCGRVADLMTERMICANELGKSACHGDSGGEDLKKRSRIAIPWEFHEVSAFNFTQKYASVKINEISPSS